MKPLSLAEKKQFFNSIDSLYSAGFSYTDLFKTIESSSVNPNIMQLARIFRSGIEDGMPVTELMMRYKEIVSPQYAMLFCAGDKSGKLENAISRIRTDITRTENLRNSLFASLTYPVLLFLGAIGVLIFCHEFFFKVFAVMYTTGIGSGARTVLFITAVFKILVVYAIIFFAVLYIVTNKQMFQRVLDFIVEKTPLANFVNSIYFINFFYVLAASYEAGIPVTESVNLASELFKTKRAIIGMSKASAILQNGGEVTSAFISAQIFNSFALSQIATGEKTGRLGEAFKNIAEDYEKNLQTTLNVITSVLQPATIVVVGIIVAYIAITFYKNLYGSMFNMF